MQKGSRLGIESSTKSSIGALARPLKNALKQSGTEKLRPPTGTSVSSECGEEDSTNDNSIELDSPTPWDCIEPESPSSLPLPVSGFGNAKLADNLPRSVSPCTLALQILPCGSSSPLPSSPPTTPLPSSRPSSTFKSKKRKDVVPKPCVAKIAAKLTVDINPDILNSRNLCVSNKARYPPRRDLDESTEKQLFEAVGSMVARKATRKGTQHQFMPHNSAETGNTFLTGAHTLEKMLLNDHILGTQEELSVISDQLMANKNELSGGNSRGIIIPFLMWLNSDVQAKLDWSVCYWSLCAFSTVFIALFSSWSAPVLAILSGLCATMASFRRPERPDDIPLAPNGIDVFLGRSFQASTDTPGLHANNNVSIINFQGRYIIAYRQSEYHFPSDKSRIVIASSTDLATWTTEWVYSNGNDLRETILIEMHGKLILYFFSLVPAQNSFKPLHVFYTTSSDAKNWATPMEVCRRGEVPWEIKVHGDKAYKASYLGDHYGTAEVLVLFEESSDGITWMPVGNSKSSSVYRGGICEVSFEFTIEGDLIAIGRNEDGDSTGFGSQLFYAKKESLGEWRALEKSIPYRFDSPRMTRTETGEVLLFARHAPMRYQLAPRRLPFIYQKMINLVLYSICGMKSAAIYRIAKPEEWGTDGCRAVQLVRCFENTYGDCGFFSIAQDLSPLGSEKQSRDQWIVANYTSTTCQSHAPWFYGQMRPSKIFVCRCYAFA